MYNFAVWKGKTQSAAEDRICRGARRPVNAHPGFYALWADGDALKPSESSLYFTDREGTHVWRLPRTMKRDFERPKIVN